VRLRTALLAVAGVALAAGCSSSGSGAGSEPVITLSPHPGHDPSISTADVRLTVSTNQRLGGFLVANGRTLYMYPPDHRRKVTCTKVQNCEAAWPPLFLQRGAKVIAGHGVHDSLIGIDRGDGGRVVTYNGWPLYHYIFDRQPGDINGQGQSLDWYVIGPDGAPIHTSSS
jgi:predicted lipoprotein with Yx(FWY)xxD motif